VLFFFFNAKAKIENLAIDQAVYRVCSESSRTGFFLGERADERRSARAGSVEGDIGNAGKNRQLALGR
jgi:hypothetical protein